MKAVRLPRHHCRLAAALVFGLALYLAPHGPLISTLRAQENGAAVAPLPPTLDRTRLPIAEPDYPRSTVLDARDAKPPPRFEVKAPAGAPNVLIVLVDDMGFGMPSAFGGPVRMPSADRLASEGLRYNQFHTTALCSPTRTALLSGRNHHMNNMGSIT